MDRDGRLNDALAREVEEAMAVEPSPDFVVRVRARVAAEPGASGWRPWRLVGAATLAATIVLTFAMGKFGSPGSGELPVPPARPLAAAPASVPREQPPIATPGSPRSVRVRPPVHAARPPVEPEILIPPGEALALRALVQSLGVGLVEGSAWAQAPPEPIRDLAIEPITIEPLADFKVLEGERTW